MSKVNLVAETSKWEVESYYHDGFGIIKCEASLPEHTENTTVEVSIDDLIQMVCDPINTANMTYRLKHDSGPYQQSFYDYIDNYGWYNDLIQKAVTKLVNIKQGKALNIVQHDKQRRA